MEAIVIGGSGATGRELVKQLVSDDRFTKIRAFLRKSYFEPHEKLEEIIVDFEKLNNFKDQVKGDVAFSCLGTTLKDAGSKTAQWHVDYDYPHQFAEMAFENDVSSFVLLSAIGVDAKSQVFYNRMKGTLEEAIKKIGFQHLLILQPGFIDRPNTNRIGEKVGIKVIQIFNRLGMFEKYAPIKTEELAKAMLESAFRFDKAVKVLSLKEIRAILG